MRTLLLIPLIAAAIVAHGADNAAASFQARVQPLLNTHCVSCHGPEKQKAKLRLDGARTHDRLASEQSLWFRVLDEVESHAMPPEEAKKQPSERERATLAAWVRGDFSDLLRAKQRKEGRAHLRRLTRTEYANTIQDLFGIRPAVGLNLPIDGRVGGYDKVSAALPLSASGAAGYFRMAEEQLAWVLRPLPKPKPAAGIVTDFDPARTVHAKAMESGQSPGHTLVLGDGTMVSFNSDLHSGRLDYPGAHTPGMHRVRFSLYAYQSDKPLTCGIYAGHTDAYPQLVDLVGIVEAPPGKPTVVETEIYLRTRDFNELAPIPDKVRIVPFGIGVQVPKNHQASQCKGPGLAVQWMEIEAPARPLVGDRWLTADLPPELDQELRSSPPVVLAGSKGPMARSVKRDEFLGLMLTTFKRVGARLYRRDLAKAELEDLMTVIATQVDAGEALREVFIGQLTGLMTSPDFLCVIEAPGRLDDFALASRLSHFLWNSTPDEALLEVARTGRLDDPKVLREQTERLLQDAKAKRFIDDFIDQWLGLRAIDDTSPDSRLYPEYGDFLKLSSVMETRAYVTRLVQEDLGVRHLVASPWALVNADLAKLYGIPGVEGAQLRQVALPDGSPHGGLWTQSAVMKVTANGTATSPVKRGVWMVERLLGVPIPPPPPDITPVDPDTRGATTLREQLAKHSAGGSCTACHAKFDPYGFALESFDVTGRHRTAYRVAKDKGWQDGPAVDCSGKTPDGKTFADIRELRALLAANPEALARGLARHLVTYATGAPVSAIDQPAIEALVKSVGGEYGVRALIHAVVQSEPFRSK
jgi:mono/diheme cytochrome c family protein